MEKSTHQTLDPSPKPEPLDPKPRPPQEFWEYELEPFTHYVPVNADLSDLVEKIEWARENDEEARAIAQNGCSRGRDLNQAPPSQPRPHKLQRRHRSSSTAKCLTPILNPNKGVRATDRNSCSRGRGAGAAQEQEQRRSSAVPLQTDARARDERS